MSRSLKILLLLSLVVVQIMSANCGAGGRIYLAFEALDIMPYFETAASSSLDTQIQVVADWESLPDILQPPYYPNDIDPFDEDERDVLNQTDFASQFLVLVIAN
jgi:hypothetical protein